MIWPTPGYHGNLGNFPAGRAVAFASLARPDLTQWHKITWNPWIACNWVYADIKSGFSRNARYWPPETAPCRLQPLRETGAKSSGTVGSRCVGEIGRTNNEWASKDCRLLRPTLPKVWTESGDTCWRRLRRSKGRIEKVQNDHCHT